MIFNTDPHPGDTFTGIAGFPKHLIIICTEPRFYSPYGEEAVLTVNVTTWYDIPGIGDPACILDVGDHPFLKHKSFIWYELAVALSVS